MGSTGCGKIRRMKGTGFSVLRESPRTELQDLQKKTEIR